LELALFLYRHRKTVTKFCEYIDLLVSVTFVVKLLAEACTGEVAVFPDAQLMLKF
jgi:hypothetical protein